MHYQQVFGCAMGSLLSAVVADLVMANIEERTSSVSPVAPRWYVDDSNVLFEENRLRPFPPASELR